MNVCIWKQFQKLFQSENFILNNFWKQKMEFLTLENFFVHDNFNIVQDKNIFLGRWTRQKWDNLELSRIWAWNLWGHLKM